MPGTRRGKLSVAAVAVSLAATAMVLTGAGWASAGPNPPGNNGTIKIDDVPFDDHPNNEPHVGCVFQVDFYGYDEGDLDAEVTFEAHPPTQRDGDDQVLLTDTVFIGEDDNSGGGSEAGLDASETYILDFTGIEPHPVQGFHVKLTIHAEGSQGADVKHKVFWVTGCGPSPTTTTTTGGTTTTTRAAPRPPPRAAPRPPARPAPRAPRRPPGPVPAATTRRAPPRRSEAPPRPPPAARPAVSCRSPGRARWRCWPSGSR